MWNEKTILAVVPARGGSKGIKLKNLRRVKGVTLVELAGRTIRNLPYIDRAVCSTDHPEIARAARECGLDVPFMRPPALSGDIIGDWDILHHALTECEKMDGRVYDVVLMIQPTSPLRKPEHVTRTVEKLIHGGYDSVWTLTETDSKHHPLKQLVIQDDLMDYLDPAGARIIARQQLTPLYHRNGAAYAITRECLLEKGKYQGGSGLGGGDRGSAGQYRYRVRSEAGGVCLGYMTKGD